MDKVHSSDGVFVERKSGTNVGVFWYAFVDVYVQVGVLHQTNCKTEASDASAGNRNANLFLRMRHCAEDDLSTNVL